MDCEEIGGQRSRTDRDHLKATENCDYQAIQKHLQSLIDKQIFFCVMNLPFGVVILQKKRKHVCRKYQQEQNTQKHGDNLA